MTLRPLLALLAAALGLLAAPSPSNAESSGPIADFTAQVLDSAGNAESRAGAHPDRLLMTVTPDPAGGNLKDLILELPPGFAGNPSALPKCPRELLSVYNPGQCPTASQAGVAEIDVLFPQRLRINSIAPDPGDLAAFGFKAALSTRLFVKALPNGQSQFEMRNSVQDAPMSTLQIEMWGIPADHQMAPTAPRKGALAMPTVCDGEPPAMKLRARSWQAPEVWHTTSADIGPPLVGCESLELHPRLDLALASATTDSPTGAHVAVSIQQNDDPDGAPVARAKDVRIRFPDGVALSPAAANLLSACPEGAVGLGRLGPTSCPASSKIGAAQLSSPLLGDTVPGTIYIGRQQSETSYRMYVVVNGLGLDLKLAGTLHANPGTGQITANISNVPQLPFDRLTLSLSGGRHALLVTPLACGSRTASAAVTPYGGGPSVSSTAAVATTADPSGRPCPASPPFAPTFVAGTSRTRAGGPGPLAVTIRRPPGDQLLDRFSLTLPRGASARLASVARCAARAAAAACSPESRIGTAIVEAGSGDSPFQLSGDVFLTGPYRHAPFGMALVFRAVAGPFDLGTISIRAALRIDPRTGQVTVRTDPLPRVVGGVPLRMQTIALDIDRPGFIANPTSCRPSRVSAVLESAGGAVLRRASRFAVGGCRALRFRPTVSMSLTGRSELRAGGRPGMRLRLRSSPRGANVRGLKFGLPRLLRPSLTGPAAICSLAQLRKDRCPAAARIGVAAARTPVLSKPLRGSIYKVQPPGDGVADVWGVIRGTGVTVRFRMTSALSRGRLRGSLVDLPDIPLSSLTMRFASGERAMFSTARNPCVGGRARRMIAKTRLVAHNAATRRQDARIRVARRC